MNKAKHVWWPLIAVALIAGGARAADRAGFSPVDESPAISLLQAPVVHTAQAVGPIVAIDSVTQSIKLRDQAGRLQTFHLDTNTPIHDSVNRQLAFDDLRPGVTISIRYRVYDQSVTAVDELRR